MAYESRIMIVNAHREKNPENKDFGKVYYAEIVANIRLGCMGYNNGWRELFTKEIDFDLYAENSNETTREDKYGEVMKEGDIENIVAWLENVAPVFWGNNPYRRVKPLLGLLKGFDPARWEELHVVHYGY